MAKHAYPNAEKTSRSTSLVPIPIDPGGTADESDVELVREQLAQVPQSIMRQIVKSGLKIIACRDNVVDFAPSLHKVQPDGWDDGKFWDDVPGAYLTTEKLVIVATVPATSGGRQVPIRGDRHGSWNLAVHELLHGFDHAAGTPSGTRPFLRALAMDRPLIGAEQGSQYFLNDVWGPRESFAEGGARKFKTDAQAAPIWAAIGQYWADATRSAIARAEPVTEFDKRPADDFIGTAYRREDGALMVNLIARGMGIEGHTLLEIPKKREASMLRHLEPIRGDFLNHKAGARGDEWMIRPATTSG